MVRMPRQIPFSTGTIFRQGYNCALYVDIEARELTIRGRISGLSSGQEATAAATPERTTGREVHCISVKPWTLPRHIGPLTAVQAIIIADDQAATDLNHLQWKALAEWVSQGGTVFIPMSLNEAEERLLKAAPLRGLAAGLSEDDSVRQVGLGCIRRYAGTLRKDEDADARRVLAESIAHIRKNEIYSHQSIGNGTAHGNMATRNRLRVIGFFAVYMFLSGIVPLVLVRSSKKRIAIFTATIVVSAAGLAGLLDGYLRSSKGNIHLTTIAKLTPGGAIEVGNVSAQSAGGRSSMV